jgi:hypothetical protein
LLFCLRHLFDFRIDSEVGAMAEHQVLDGCVAGLADEATPLKKLAIINVSAFMSFLAYSGFQINPDLIRMSLT